MFLWGVAAFVALVGLSRLATGFRAQLARELAHHMHQAKNEKDQQAAAQSSDQ